MENHKDTNWEISLDLQAPQLVPPAVQWTFLDEDPVPAFKARIREMRASDRERPGQAKNEAGREEERQFVMLKQWDRGFKEIPGNETFLLTAGTSGSVSSNGPDGKKWIVTRVGQIKGQPVCWCLPVELKKGIEIKAALTEENAFDLGAAFDSALQEAGPSTEGNLNTEELKDRGGRITLELRVPGQPSPVVQWALFDQDPGPGFKAGMEQVRPYYREQLEQAENQAAKDNLRTSGMSVVWDMGFGAIPGDRLFLLTSGCPHTFPSNMPDGKKWLVTKVGRIEGKPVCWCLAVEVKTGEETKATLTEENAFDLRATFDSVLRETKASTKEGKRMEEMWHKTWRLGLDLGISGLEPPAVQMAVLDQDPVPGFTSRIQEKQVFYRERLKRAANEAAKERERTSAMIAGWDLGFREIKGSDLSLLTSVGFTCLSSNGPDGKKWIVTKVRQLRGKPVCWCLPVEVKTGQEIRATLTEKNVFGLGTAFDRALQESGASTEPSTEIEEAKGKSWRIALDLRVPGLVPPAVSFAILDQDPVPGFKASVKKLETLVRGFEQSETGSAQKGMRKAAMIGANWDGIFKAVSGDRLSLLTSPEGPHVASAEGPGGKKWIVTQAVQLKGKPVCWCLPVEVKTDEEIQMTLTENNVFDLETTFESALREP